MTEHDANERARPALADLCGPLFGLAICLKGAEEPASPDRLRESFHQTAAEFERKAAAAGYASETVDHASYALHALVDEIVLNSNWSIRDSWSGKPLQKERFGSMGAGAKVFERLEETVASSSPDRGALLEVYQHCLGLGFRGMHHGLEGRSRLRTLTTEVGQQVLSSRQQSDDRLSRNVAVAQSLPQQVRSIPVWLVAVVACAFVLVLFITLKIMLENQYEAAFGTGVTS